MEPMSMETCLLYCLQAEYNFWSKFNQRSTGSGNIPCDDMESDMGTIDSDRCEHTHNQSTCRRLKNRAREKFKNTEELVRGGMRVAVSQGHVERGTPTGTGVLVLVYIHMAIDEDNRITHSKCRSLHLQEYNCTSTWYQVRVL